MTELTVWVVYNSPEDYPDLFVLRANRVTAAGVEVAAPAAVTLTLDEVRRHIPPGLYHQPPDVTDDPAIVETWF